MIVAILFPPIFLQRIRTLGSDAFGFSSVKFVFLVCHFQKYRMSAPPTPKSLDFPAPKLNQGIIGSIKYESNSSPVCMVTSASQTLSSPV